MEMYMKCTGKRSFLYEKKKTNCKPRAVGGATEWDRIEKSVDVRATRDQVGHTHTHTQK